MDERSSTGPERKGEWLAAMTVRACSKADPPFQVAFTRDTTRDVVAEQRPLALLEDESKQRVVHTIIMRFFGEEIKSDDMVVVPTGWSSGSRTTALTSRESSQMQTTGEPLGRPAKMEVSAFIARFAPPAKGRSRRHVRFRAVS